MAGAPNGNAIDPISDRRSHHHLERGGMGRYILEDLADPVWTHVKPPSSWSGAWGYRTGGRNRSAVGETEDRGDRAEESVGRGAEIKGT